VYPRTTDASTAGLDQIPPLTPITVTVWRRGEVGAELVDEGEDWTDWTDERFDAAFESSGGSPEFLRKVRRWAERNDVSLRYGAGRTEGPLHFDVTVGRDTVTLMSLGAGGGIEWVFRGNLDRAPGLTDRDARVRFVRRIRDLFEVDRPDDRADTWLSAPSHRVERAADPEFLNLLDEELAATRRPSTELGLQYQRLFQSILDRFKALRPGATGRARVGTENWLDFSAGRSGFLWVWSTAHNKYFRVELYIDVGNQDENKRLFDKLHERAAELEHQLGLPIAWERLPAKRASRLAVYYETLDENFDIDDTMIEWAAQTMSRFIDVIGPAIRSL
jgi:hypothetical protein